MKEYPNNQKGVLCILYETNKNLFSILHTDTDRSDTDRSDTDRSDNY